MAFKWDGVIDLEDGKCIAYCAEASFYRDEFYTLHSDNVKLKTWLYTSRKDLEGCYLPRHLVTDQVWGSVEEKAVEHGFDEYVRQLGDKSNEYDKY